jgi:conjugal transfer pilus assembly protein TraF
MHHVLHLIFFVLVFGSATSWATESARGWHFYKRPPAAIVKPPVSELGDVARPPEASAMSTAWLRENLPRFQDAALDNPTPQNIEILALMNRLAIDRADRLATGMELLAQTNPVLDASSNAPTSTIGRAAMDESTRKARAEAFGKISQRAGLYYFFRHDCPFCHKQNPVLRSFADAAGLEVLAISLDGLPMPDGSYPDFVVDQGQAMGLGVEVTPTLALVVPGQPPRILAQGVRSIPELEARLLANAVSMNLISSHEHALATRGTDTRLFTGDGLRSSELSAAAADPEQLLSLLRSAVPNGGGASPVNSISGAIR